MKLFAVFLVGMAIGVLETLLFALGSILREGDEYDDTLPENPCE